MGLVLAIAAICVVVGATRAQPAQAQPACVGAILEDWMSGELGPTYPGDCYEAAIDALPEDLRAYTSAADDISRAMAAALRSGDVESERELSSSPASTRSEDVRALPAVVVALAALVAALAASGLGAYAIRQRRDR